MTVELREYRANVNRHDVTSWPREIQFLEWKDCGGDGERRIRVFLPNGLTVNGRMVGTCCTALDDAADMAMVYIKKQGA